MTSPRVQPAVTHVYVTQIFVVASLLTSAFMLSTATELGPMGPLVIAEGLYLAGFAFVVELGLAARTAFALASRAIGRRRATDPPQGE